MMRVFVFDGAVNAFPRVSYVDTFDFYFELLLPIGVYSLAGICYRHFC